MSYTSSVHSCPNCYNYAYQGGYQCYQHCSSYPSYYSSQPGSTPMIPNTSQDSNGSSNSSYSQRSSNTYASSPSTTDAYSPTGYQSSYPTSSTTRTHYPILAPSRPLPPPPTPSQPPVSSSSEKKSKSSKPTPYICVYRGCTRQFARSFDLDRHMKTHFPNAIQKLDCPKGAQGSFCRRVGEKGFTRKDHLDEHLRKVHLVDLPKSARGTRG